MCSAYLKHQIVDFRARPHFVPYAMRELHGGSALGPAVQDLLAASTWADTVAAAVPGTLAVCLPIAPCSKRVITARVGRTLSCVEKALTSAVKGIWMKDAHALHTGKA